MRIQELNLKTASLSSQREYYGQVLRLPILAERGGKLSIQAGGTRLVFEATEGWRGAYHIAFDVPENQFNEAKAWMMRRTSLIKLNDQDEFNFQNWNAHSLYFYDAAGNVLEFIARHNQPTASHKPFSARSIVSVSEIGLATDDVPATVQSLCDTLGVAVYDGEGSDSFTAVGDEEGLFIVVRNGRAWYPETGVKANPYPVTVALENAPLEGYKVPDLPYFIRSIHERQSLSPTV
jgi:catechol-2,3-dioxygenase